MGITVKDFGYIFERFSDVQAHAVGKVVGGFGGIWVPESGVFKIDEGAGFGF